MIRPVEKRDATRIAEIYNHYITETLVTFEEIVLTAADIETRMATIESKGYPWIVFELEGSIIGYAYAGTWRSRAAFRHTVEIAVYLAHDNIGKGVGRQLYGALLDELRKQEIRAVIGMVSLPNPASAKLHEHFGFTKVGEFPAVGYKFDTWIDVGAWQLLLEKD
jgi:phosphinothricin acetyltransferase